MVDSRPDVRGFVEVTGCQCWPMNEAWHNNVLYGAYWRFVRCFDRGAGLDLDGEKLELAADRVYLLPPNCAMKVWQTGNPVQFFIHFVASEKYNRVSKRFYSFYCDLFMEERISSIRKGMRDGSCDSTNNWLEAVALASYGLSKIPEGDLLQSNIDYEVARLMNLMRDDPQKDYSVKDMAGAMGMCQDSFIRRFKRFATMTPYQYLISQRMSLAIYLLENSEDPLSDVAEKSGFKDQFNFSRVFKSRIGLSPGQYRSSGQRGMDGIARTPSP